MKCLIFMILMVFSLQLSAQKYLKDSLEAIFKENTDLKNQIKEVQISNARILEKMETLKYYETVEWSALGIVVALLLVVFAGGVLKVKQDLETEQKELTKNIKLEQEKLLSDAKKVYDEALAIKREMDITFQSTQFGQNTQENDN